MNKIEKGNVITTPSLKGEWIIEDYKYYPTSNDSYGDYVPSNYFVTLRKLRFDGSYNPTGITRKFATSHYWTGGKIKTQIKEEELTIIKKMKMILDFK